jgi:DNA helicase-2/ATP-dependent DNA helicase PcrA
MVHNPDDEVSLGRIINVPGRGIGEKTMLSLTMAARQAHISLGQVLLDLGKNGDASPYWQSLSGRGAVMLADFGVLLGSWIELRDKVSLPALFDRILRDVVYQEYIQDKSEEGEDRWGNVQELLKLAYEYQDRGLTDFLENLALVSDQDTLPEALDAPTLLTLHAAKGLEFPQVFIIGLDEGILPHSRSRDDPEQMMEERRLFYVGITRAKDRLYLVRAQRRSTYGSYEFSDASQFLDDIPANLLKVLGASSSARRTTHSDYSSPSRVSWSTPPAPPKPAPQQRYRPAMRIKHPAWGDGMVLDSRIVDGEEMVDVFFDSVGFKRLMASIAPLELL